MITTSKPTLAITFLVDSGSDKFLKHDFIAYLIDPVAGGFKLLTSQLQCSLPIF